MPTISTVTLNDGTAFPEVGLGTYKLRDDEGIDAIVAAISSGYRLLDSAVNYENEARGRRSGAPCRRRAGGRPRRAASSRRRSPAATTATTRPWRAPRRSLATLGLDADRSVPHPLAQPQRRQVPRDLAGDDRASRGRARRLDRRLELHRGDADAAHRRDRRHARGQPGRAAPVLPAERAARVPPRARHPHRELESSRAPRPSC